HACSPSCPTRRSSDLARRDSGARPLPFDKAGALTFVLDGLSKRCALPQLKVGWIGVFGPRFAVEPVMAVLDSIGDTYLGVNSIKIGRAHAELQSRENL